MTLQKRNAEMVELLRPDFQARYEPNFALVNACALHQAIPGLRGFWPLSSVDNTGAAYDLSGQTRTLTYNGNPAYGISGLAPYCDFDGTGDYLSRADEAGLDILGTETIFPTALRGLTFGGWFQIDTLAGGTDGLIGKWNDNAVNQRSYLLDFNTTTNVIRFQLSTDGTAIVSVSSAAVAAATWLHCIARFDPSTELALWVNGVKTTNLVAIPASVFNSTAQLNIGAYSNGASGLLEGWASMCFLSSAFLPDVWAGVLFEQTRALYGV